MMKHTYDSLKKGGLCYCGKKKSSPVHYKKAYHCDIIGCSGESDTEYGMKLHYSFSHRGKTK